MHEEIELQNALRYKSTYTMYNKTNLSNNLSNIK